MPNLSEKLRHLLDQYREFMENHLMPVEMDLLTEVHQGKMERIDQIRRMAGEQGLWNAYLPASMGGMDFSLQEFAHISEMLGRSPFGHYIANCQAPDVGNVELLAAHASDSLKERYLRPLLNAECRSCFAMTEPENAGSNPLLLQSRAVYEDGSYRINGHKWFVSGADGAAFTIVMAVTDPEAANPYERCSMIVLPMESPGLELVRNISVMGDEGHAYFSHAELRFHDCRVPADHLIGPEGAGFVLAQERLGPGRIHHCMRWIGICERAFDIMCRRAAGRAIGKGRFLGERQAVQYWIAESRAEIDAARLMVLQTAALMDEQGNKAARTAISTIKFYVADVLMKVLDRAIQCLGALGITDDTPLSFWYRHERGARIYDGPDEVHKAVVARKILAEYGLKTKR